MNEKALFVSYNAHTLNLVFSHNTQSSMVSVSFKYFIFCFDLLDHMPISLKAQCDTQLKSQISAVKP